jgi:hypothetical protein
MPALPSSNPAQFVQGAPVLHVEDVKATAAFYRDVLGFTWDFGDEAYAVVWRDNSAIHFVRDEGNPRGVHLFQWGKESTLIIERSLVEAPRSQRHQQTSPMGSANLVYAISTVWASCSARTSITADMERP